MFRDFFKCLNPGGRGALTPAAGSPVRLSGATQVGAPHTGSGDTRRSTGTWLPGSPPAQGPCTVVGAAAWPSPRRDPCHPQPSLFSATCARRQPRSCPRRDNGDREWAPVTPLGGSGGIGDGSGEVATGARTLSLPFAALCATPDSTSEEQQELGVSANAEKDAPSSLCRERDQPLPPPPTRGPGSPVTIGETQQVFQEII